MNRSIILFLTLITFATADAQVLTLDSCRAMALRSNKQMGIAKVKKDVAENTRKAARTKYLPHIDVAGGYIYSSREISILNDEQKAVLGNAGTMAATDIGTKLGPIIQKLDHPFDIMAQQMMQNLAEAGDAIGQRVIDAFRTNTHHIFTASAMLTQPLYMGGAITAANRMADIAEKMAEINIEAKEHDIQYGIDNTYWTVVSLKQKQRLAEGYLALVKKLNSDVHKMIENGVATRADGLKVDVAVNEAEMTKTKVDNGLTLARMLLCQMCGMPLDSPVILADEDKEELAIETFPDYSIATAMEQRPELRLLSNALDLTKQQTKLARSGYMPQIALTTGAVFSNPSVYNGFERKFKGAFNVGVMVRVPVLDWGETMYRVRTAKCSTTLAQMEYDEAQEMVELQVNQCNFKVREARKNLANARKNILSAEENLRCANLGFKEGVMQTTDVMAAQTAWLQAQTQKVDAEIELKLSEASMKKALGMK